MVTGTPEGHHLISGLGNSWRALRTSSGEPGLNASVVERAIGVPGGVRDPSHGASHYGPPGQESLQPKRVSKIHRLFLHLQDRLVGIIETKEATKTRAQRLSGKPRKLVCVLTHSPGRQAAPSTLKILRRAGMMTHLKAKCGERDPMTP